MAGSGGLAPTLRLLAHAGRGVVDHLQHRGRPAGGGSGSGGSERWGVWVGGTPNAIEAFPIPTELDRQTP